MILLSYNLWYRRYIVRKESRDYKPTKQPGVYKAPCLQDFLSSVFSAARKREKEKGREEGETLIK